ncbi:MAG: tRNA (N6-threonylcarbamoyladenosine(37)-N6)-methyltransferase TrmO [Colwellia sp.]|nr:tRNA (N6-threonylcarbamoyladenosine(37)-N6)-methyltransferase TrmO [Colwellia sp.]
MTEVISELTLSPIGVVNSPYKEKFAIPRQPGLVNSAKGTIKLLGDVNNIESVRGLTQFSHIWLLFVFHGSQEHGWKPLVKPPRLGGNKKIGVLATRSTFRPNPIGMSVVKLDKVQVIKQEVILHISGLDLLDKTPIIDIKPYVPYSDSVPNANAGFAQTEPQLNLTVEFSKQAQSTLLTLKQELPELALFIKQVLSQDPRPAYKQNKTDKKIYGMILYNLNIQWQMLAATNIEVIQINRIEGSC